jgi:hypothetical protein
LAVLLAAAATGFLVWTAQREAVGPEGPGAAVPAEGNPPIFPDGEAFNEPIDEAPKLDPATAEMEALLEDPQRPPTMNLNEFGNPIYVADASTPRYDLVVTRNGTEEGRWGNNVLADASVPIPPEVEPSSGSDAKIVIIDASTNQVFDLWRVERVGGRWQAEWGGIYPLDGTGSSLRSAYGTARYHVPWPEPVSRGTGSGISSLAGVIRAQELADGRIDHALVFSTDKPCGPANSGPYRWPATTTDGYVVDEPCIPQGARVQLDPTLDLDAMTELTPVERIVGKALQEFGAYCVDGGGSRMAFATEAARTPAQRAIYAGLALSDDYHGLPNLPREYTVLASWDGS